MNRNLEQDYPTLVSQDIVVNKKYNQKMMLKLKNGKDGYCLLTYLPQNPNYVSFATFEICEKRPKKLYLYYLATTQENVGGKGIGYENINFLLNFAKKYDCLTMEFRYCPQNKNAVELYKKFPFELVKDDYDQRMLLFLNNLNKENVVTK